ncbi:CPBP family intramembrane metalloprotease [Polaribacter vadi]|uniref:CPBP family intramembrane glutamic endopeptidase n=1 Tax=Polaribacter TaxID=52959 RepID=UPI001C095842|nr:MULTISPECIES: CPBP family intramembrane glutamic endopeptidase [Polaribacter]MBU3011430.1 CPBP family intramembrane metalloprotease [Polaribacter vadi]MDO6741242.1 CPBP family intramembrane metalloprotease [Polaribacter sp. 1_MG-2023]
MSSFLEILKQKKCKFIEIFFLFIVAPVVLLLPISIIIKVIYVGLGVVYITLISIFKEKFSKIKTDKKSNKKVVLEIGIRFLIIALLTTLVLYYQNKEQLFNVILNKPDLWLKFSGVYILFSVIPQELIYRTFFVKRYQNLIKNKWLFIFINSVLFSFAHIWFQSFTVLAFSFVGSLLFAHTYLKTKSNWLIILEHSIYGVCLYTVGYGELFMFPV